jgi:hypothetical protein
MYDAHAQRSKGWSGLAFVAVVIASVFVGGMPPAATASGSEIASYAQSHTFGVLLSVWLALPAAVFFLWFAVGMRAYLARPTGPDEGLPMYALVSGVTAVVVSLGGAALTGGAVYSAMTHASTSALPLLWSTATILNGPVIFVATSAFVFASAHSMRRHGTGAPWLANWGYATAIVSFVATLSLFFPAGSMSMTGTVPLLGLLLFLIWMIGTSVVLIRQASRELSGAVPAV